MTAQEALQASSDSIARAHVDGGLVSIARSPDGYQLSFFPKTAEGLWNLAGTISIGSFPSVEAAADTAWTQCGADPSAWESAPENIVGTEPSASLVPSVEGHHLRHHGTPEQPEGMRATFLGHPLHPQLILFPAGLLPYSFLMDVMHHATGRQSYADAAYHTMWGGFVGGLAAGAAGAVDYSSIKEESKSKPVANLHAGMNIGILALYGLNLLSRANGNRRPGLLSTVLSGIGTAGLLVSAWYGAHLVYDHGMRVRGVDELARARDVAPPGDDTIKESLEQLPSALPG
jgi:uncharacterized membrane protein